MSDPLKAASACPQLLHQHFERVCAGRYPSNTHMATRMHQALKLRRAVGRAQIKRQLHVCKLVAHGHTHVSGLGAQTCRGRRQNRVSASCLQACSAPQHRPHIRCWALACPLSVASDRAAPLYSTGACSSTGDSQCMASACGGRLQVFSKQLAVLQHRRLQQCNQCRAGTCTAPIWQGEHARGRR